ncbi:type II toxin-antitoxin system HicA family toxin [Verticiella sediminum]|uniref:Type II toxin-antitoxin system HicA family toxin n=1 Tax=Verticiella sediminum TaxID=1247510 RepID=A0A556ARL3_9BURK|nr:type II toxin-antitoxin system HicA family toxin [Verticiella sediminum]TSH95572.1 type II toxin-antitoxin system HicA family toxin [Verticiella sediminum]
MNLVYSCVLCIITHTNSADIIKRLKADGWYRLNTVGSHHQFKHPTKPGKVTVPHPKKDLPEPTLRSIMKQAGLK